MTTPPPKLLIKIKVTKIILEPYKYDTNSLIKHTTMQGIRKTRWKLCNFMVIKPKAQLCYYQSQYYKFIVIKLCVNGVTENRKMTQVMEICNNLQSREKC
jgi:hypothetical protein